MHEDAATRRDASEAHISSYLQGESTPWVWERLPAALMIAHPGHELRVHHWLERARPLVLVLTDGSGHSDRSRLASTTAVLERAGATPGPIYGRLSDRDLYRAILANDVDLFSDLADEIAQVLEEAGVSHVAGDAVEGFNPGHDLCRLLLNSALLRIERRRGGSPQNFELTLEAPPCEGLPENGSEAILLELDDGALQRKLASARSYPELAGEVERTLALHGQQAFRRECLQPVRYGLDIGHRFEHPPYYERYGEQQVAAGIYREVVRFRDHLAPLAASLGRHAVRAGV